jgi:putative acetyltransferase
MTMAEARPKFNLRPMLPDDGPALTGIFRASIEELTGDDYDAEQQDAWMAAADDEEAFAARLAGELTLVATLNGSPVAFASLQGADHIDMVYVHPAAARSGVASMLVDALERLAGSRGAARITADVSDSAREFFDGRGYHSEMRNMVMRGDAWLGNTAMAKTIADLGEEQP